MSIVHNALAGPTAVTYEGLPIGAGGAHRLGRMGLREAHRRTEAFVEACGLEIGPRHRFFMFPNVPGMDKMTKWEGQLEAQFGPRVRDRIPVLETQVEEALSFLDDINPQPVNPWGMAPIWFTSAWKIAMVDPETLAPFPGQDSARYGSVPYSVSAALGESHIRLRLSDRAALGADLCFPDVDDSKLQSVLPMLQEHAPFRFSPKHWRRWSPTKTGSFTSRSITPPT